MASPDVHRNFTDPFAGPFPGPKRRTRGLKAASTSVVVIFILFAAGCVGLDFHLVPFTTDGGATRFTTPGGAYTVTFPLKGTVQSTSDKEGIVYGVANSDNSVAYFVQPITPAQLGASMPPGVTPDLFSRLVVDQLGQPGARQAFAAASGLSDLTIRRGDVGGYEAAVVSATAPDAGNFVPGFKTANFRAALISCGSNLVVFGTVGGSTQGLESLERSFRTNTPVSLYNLASTSTTSIDQKVSATVFAPIR
jgi:hypothetical protein